MAEQFLERFWRWIGSEGGAGLVERFWKVFVSSAPLCSVKLVCDEPPH